ncbi:hypothetical protein [Microvirga lotononidis]|uniref:Uncharacterized protein n=1 Tax=Microvirga lotononidis TaxID=864069 RepID=I4YSS5_9HYPH|nr:hypothetical protein [Microvirga lotononidis]EIM27017.1 hypothetical protein MicloDRAFT_00035710 [Microvirga lotononidis]WQO28793.1 hypothetical protein U0023_06885 [Microvirga lotononidis]
MTWSDLAARVFKAAIALVSAVVMDYAFLNGRMTRQAVTGIERMAADAPVLIDRLVTSVLNIKWER